MASRLAAPPPLVVNTVVQVGTKHAQPFFKPTSTVAAHTALWHYTGTGAPLLITAACHGSTAAAF
jgi:hypothetical protein